MKLDFEDLTVNDPESRGLRTLRIGEGNNQVGGFRVIRAFNIFFRWPCRSTGMRMIDRHQFLAPTAQISKRGDQLCRIHFISRRAAKRILHRNKTIRGAAPHKQSAGLVWIICLRVVNHAIQQTGCKNEIHKYIMAGKACRP